MYIELGNGEKIDINEALIKKNNVSPESIQKMPALYTRLIEIADELKSMSHEEVVQKNEYARKIAAEVTSIEFALQELWNFPRDPKMHKYWYHLPHCECPKMDNADPLCLGPIYVSSCPLHGIVKAKE